MIREIDPKTTSRSYAFEMWMRAPMPMVTLFKRLDVTGAIKVSYKYALKFNMLMCWCVGKAASRVKEFYLLPIGDKLFRYDSIAVNTIVTDSKGEVRSCDIPFIENLTLFNKEYIRLTAQVAHTRKNHDISESMVIGTSALVRSEIEGAVGMYSGIFNNPFLIWGRYRKRWFRTTLMISFQFHHTQMDGAHAANFLDFLQEEIKNLPDRII